MNKLTPAQKAGLSYQKRVGKFLLEWATAIGWQLHNTPRLRGCEPDFLLEAPSGCLIVVEAKLTQVDCQQQTARYKKVTGSKVALQVCRRLVSPATVHCLEDAVDGGVMLLWV